MSTETFQGPHGRYWLSTDAGRHWIEVDRDAYVAAEREAGFSAPEGQEATAAFGNGTLRGTTLDPHRRTVSFRVRYAKLGGHIHVKVWSSEYGPDTAHGLNGRLAFRESEWLTFRKLLECGAVHYGPMDGAGLPSAGVVEFIEDGAVTDSPFDPGGEAR